MTLDEAQNLTLKILKQVMEEKLDHHNVQIARVSSLSQFYIRAYSLSCESRLPQTRASRSFQTRNCRKLSKQWERMLHELQFCILCTLAMKHFTHKLLQISHPLISLLEQCIQPQQVRPWAGVPPLQQTGQACASQRIRHTPCSWIRNRSYPSGRPVGASF